MNIKIQEDNKTFREFYPDASVRHQVHYAFAHMFLPQYIHQNPYAFFSSVFCQNSSEESPTEPSKYIHSRWALFERMTGLVERERDLFKEGMVFRRISDLSMTVQKMAGKATALIRLPKPEQHTEAFFVAAVLLAVPESTEEWPRDVQARVFTLEATLKVNLDEPEKGVICEWTKEGEHKNYGFCTGTNPEMFLQTLAILIQSSDLQAASGFTPDKDGTPGNITLYVGDNPTNEAAADTKKERPWWKIW